MNGSKSVEIRTRLPLGLRAGDRVFVCVSGTHGMVPFSFGVEWSARYRTDYAWEHFYRQMCVSWDEYNGYVGEREYVCLVWLDDVHVFHRPISIGEFGLNRPPMWFSSVNYRKVLR